MLSKLRSALLSAALVGLIAPAAQAQDRIAFSSELPRTLVFIQERGDGGTATRDVVNFLREAGFPLVDPALAHTAAQRDLVQSALAGDEGAAVQLGRDFGAHVLVLGVADWGTAVDPATGTLMTGTAEVELRAIRLDQAKVLISERANGRDLDATEQGARTKAIRQAVDKLIGNTAFVGSLANNWEEEPWSARGYFSPDPGSVGAAVNAAAPAGAPKLAIIRTDVLPPVGVDAGTRGIGIVKKRARGQEGSNDVRIEGIAVGDVAQIMVEDKEARLEPLDAAEATRLGVGDGAVRFSASLTLPLSQDTVRVVATGRSGDVATAFAAPRIAQRWAVVVGIGDYRSPDVADLRYTSRDAQAVYDFLRSPAAGPFEEDNILFLQDEDATLESIRNAMFQFLQQAAWNDMVFIYFAGHGAPDPSRPDNLYLLPVDADPRALAATAFPMWDVKTALRRQIKAERVVVIADACHSGGTAEGSDNAIGAAFADLFTPSRRLTLTAADESELSYEDARWGGGHGAFTFHFLDGLKGAADADANGIVTFEEVATHVTSKVAADTNGRQNPQFSGLGDVPLAVVSAPSAATGGN